MTDPINHSPKTFIYDHKRSMDPCVHADIVKLSGFFSVRLPPRPRKTFTPLFSLSATYFNFDILVVPVEDLQDAPDDVPWEEKPFDQLVWRGSTTGMRYLDGLPWRTSQRIRLVEIANRKSGTIPVLRTPSNHTADWTVETMDIKDLNSAMMDIGISAAKQCEPSVCEAIKTQYEMRDSMFSDQSKKYKYIMDVDGNAWSARFRRIMGTNSLVLKSTIHPEWWTDRAMPWLHYVPVKLDYSDLYDIMTFFRGDAQGIGGHDDLAANIAKAGREWAETYYRREDMAAYMFRLFLEWGRLVSDDRAQMTMP